MQRTLEEVHADPIFQALNPENNRQFMMARWLPPELNEFAEFDIKVAALIPFGTFPHIKAVATVQMMVEDFKAGLYDDKHTIVVDSSGNTAHAVARLARAFGFHEVKVVLSTDVPESKKGILSALSSVEIIEVGGGRSVAKRAEEEAQKPGHHRLNQYSHMGNVRAHERYTGPEVLRVLGDSAAVVAVAMGSGGTACGVGRFFREYHPQTVILAVRPMLGEQVPGARDEKKMAEVVTLPWKGVVDMAVEVSRKESFVRMRKLWSAVEPQPGPTSGLAWGGLEHYLENEALLGRFRGKTLGFICPDDGRFYSERTTGELDTDQGL
ncbi:MAG: pyridoxal-phosphate dependent enzyme [bacterium]|nr:pyridoxal-phosphate dependent enzyme [bacterium]